jgi:hypothetical protein
MIRITQTEPFEPIYVNVSTGGTWNRPWRRAMEPSLVKSVLEAALLAARAADAQRHEKDVRR